jgi:hypothetical protein
MIRLDSVIVRAYYHASEEAAMADNMIQDEARDHQQRRQQ